MISTLLLFAAIISSSAQVVINEYSCSNLSTIVDNYNEHEDWFELYNQGATLINLGGYYLSDRLSNPDKWQIPPGISIPANGRIIFFASGRAEVSGSNYHTNFKLTQTKNEHIVLSDQNNLILDVVQIIPTQKDHSRGRSTDGAQTWSLFTSPTPNSANTAASEEYMPEAVFGLSPGAYPSGISLNITSGSGAEIRYTTDGSEPTAASSLYTVPLIINNTTVVKVKVYDMAGINPPGFTSTATYFINTSHHIPVISISGEQVDNLLNGSSFLEPLGFFEFFDSTLTLLDNSYGNFNKHGNDSWAYQQRGFDFISRDEYGYNYAINEKVFRIKSRDSYQRLILKPAANDNYPFANGAHIRDAYVHVLSQLGDLNLDERTHEPCIVYLNGEYWGVYEIREKVDDHDFTEYYYDQKKKDLQFLKTWGGTWSEYGGAQAQTDWNTLRTFITGNDMTIQTNFDYVSTLYDWTSLVDYIVLNSYVVCSDWLNWNTAWWRGLNPSGDMQKWRYTLWDEDATFGHYINYTGIPNTTPTADPCNPEFLSNPGGQGHIPVLNALFENEVFQQYYVSRFIDLSNTVFNCQNMQHLLDSLIDLIEPEMNGQITKWGGSLVTWQNEVTELKNFIDERCINLADGMIDCYDLTGPFDMMYNVEPELSGRIKINSITPGQYPFYGTYFGDIPILLEAIPAQGYKFDHWEPLHNTFSNPIDEEVAFETLGSDTIVAIFIPLKPVVDLGIDTAICEGSSLLLNAQNDGATFIWNDGSTSQTLLVSEAGSYSVSVSNYGETTSDVINVSVIQLPTLDLGEDQQICDTQVLTLTATAENTDSVIWSTQETGLTIMVNQADTYFATGINTCGTYIDSIEIYEGTSPQLNLGPDLNMEEGQLIILDATNIDANYLWQDNSTQATYLVTEPGNYWVFVTNSCGTAFDDVNIGYDAELIVPNAFSPNGVNQKFEIYSKGISDEDFLLQIYNRWGELVFETEKKDESWDGNLKHPLKETSVFHYILKYKDFAGKNFYKKGVITVIIK